MQAKGMAWCSLYNNTQGPHKIHTWHDLAHCGSAKSVPSMKSGLFLHSPPFAQSTQPSLRSLHARDEIDLHTGVVIHLLGR